MSKESPPGDLAGAEHRISTSVYRLQPIQARKSSWFIAKIASKTVKILKEGKKDGFAFTPD